MRIKINEHLLEFPITLDDLVTELEGMLPEDEICSKQLKDIPVTEAVYNAFTNYVKNEKLPTGLVIDQIHREILRGQALPGIEDLPKYNIPIGGKINTQLLRYVNLYLSNGGNYFNYFNQAAENFLDNYVQYPRVHRTIILPDDLLDKIRIYCKTHKMPEGYLITLTYTEIIRQKYRDKIKDNTAISRKLLPTSLAWHCWS